METNEILANEDVIETAEEIVEANSGKGFKVAAGVGLTALAGFAAYKYIVKPIVAKIKAKKEKKHYATVDPEVIEADFEESTED